MAGYIWLALALMVIEASQGAAVASEGGMPQLDPVVFMPQIVWLVITFTALYFLMAKMALPRIGGAIEKRRSRIADDLDEAQSLKIRSDKAIAAYEQSLAEARAQAHTIAQENREIIRDEVDGERAKLDAEIAARLDSAHDTIAVASAKAMKEIDKVAVSAAQEIVLRLSGEKVTKAVITKAMSG